MPTDLSGRVGYPQQYVMDVGVGDVWQVAASGQRESSEILTWLLTWSPDGEALVSVTGGGKSALYLAPPAEPFRHLVTITASVSKASWSPDGRLLAAGGHVIDPGIGEIVTKLPMRGQQIMRWSADGRYLAVSGGTSDDPRVLIWDRETGLIEQLPAESGVWSSSGHRFAYAPARLRRTSEPKLTGIWVRDLDGMGGDLIATFEASSATPIAWSLDDRYLAVRASQWHESETMSFVTHETRIIDTSGDGSEVIVHGTWPAGWVGASRTFLLTGNICGAFDIFTVQADGSNLRNYTDSPALDLYPRPSPDARRVAFTTFGNSGSGTIRLLTLATGETTELASGSGVSLLGGVIAPEAVWSPDGRHIVFGIEGGRGLCEVAQPQTTEVEVLP